MTAAHASAEAASDAAEILRARAHGRVRIDAPIGPWTSYRIGGPAAVLFEPATADDLVALSAAIEATGVDLLMVGRGSNMLVSDRGFPGVACRLGSGFRWTAPDPPRIRAGAAVPLPALATLALDHGLAGMEFGVAIPASLGGAVMMNAGAHGAEMKDVLETVDVFLIREGRAESIPAERAGFAYRTSSLPAGAIVTAATMALAAGDAPAIEERMREARTWRRETQPLSLPNGGSVFKNPSGDTAGRLIDEVCGRSMAVGEARISDVHANFIVAGPGARADDVYTLIRRIQRRVEREAGVELQTELKLVGGFEEAPDERG